MRGIFVDGTMTSVVRAVLRTLIPKDWSRPLCFTVPLYGVNPLLLTPNTSSLPNGVRSMYLSIMAGLAELPKSRRWMPHRLISSGRSALHVHFITSAGQPDVLLRM